MLYLFRNTRPQKRWCSLPNSPKGTPGAILVNSMLYEDENPAISSNHAHPTLAKEESNTSKVHHASSNVLCGAIAFDLLQQHHVSCGQVDEPDILPHRTHPSNPEHRHSASSYLYKSHLDIAMSLHCL
mmetsp:Transcript_91156/g.174867  ORF Transcript_91156/g.174867 Transcript_91156/m.174867 type:complete len:128 (+) Transcript_91156:783-1166(+)